MASEQILRKEGATYANLPALNPPSQRPAVGAVDLSVVVTVFGCTVLRVCASVEKLLLPFFNCAALRVSKCGAAILVHIPPQTLCIFALGPGHTNLASKNSEVFATT